MFAGSVMLGDLNDFIAPSQSCVNPLVAARPSTTSTGSAAESLPPAAAAGGAKITLSLEFDLSDAVVAPGASARTAGLVRPNLIRKDASSNAAKVSLNDCLACSGCVTSAETVLITQQSVDEVLSALRSDRFALRAISLSPQSLASICAHYGLPDVLDCYERLTTFLKESVGFDIVIDTIVGAEFSLLESAREFVDRFASNLAHTSTGADTTDATAAPSTLLGEVPVRSAFAHGGRWVAPTPTVAVSASSCKVILPGMNAWTADAPTVSNASLAEATDSLSGAVALPDRSFPLLAGSCPGWVCYAEKTVPECLPHISTVKSPQHATGSLLKHFASQTGLVPLADLDLAVSAGLRSRRGLVAHPGLVYHVTVMPCYDRKLEASRKDFAWDSSPQSREPGAAGAAPSGDGGATRAPGGLVPEVDCVLTTGEIVDMLSAAKLHLADVRRTRRVGFAATDAGKAAPYLLEQLLCGVSSSSAARSIDGDAVAPQPPYLVRSAGSEASSDAYAEFIFAYAAKHLFGAGPCPQDTLPLAPLCATPPGLSSASAAGLAAADLPGYTVGRNPDWRERCLVVGEKPVLRVALAYGFRNIQAVVQRMKRGKCDLHYVEVMACPSGCVNGGGQQKVVSGAPSSSTLAARAASRFAALAAGIADARGDDADFAAPSTDFSAAVAAGSYPAVDPAKRRIAEVCSLLHGTSNGGAVIASVRQPHQSPAVAEFFRAILEDAIGDRVVFAILCRLLFHTQYHHVPKLDISVASKW